jgi:predicted SAM-dependent methyltransferase
VEADCPTQGGQVMVFGLKQRKKRKRSERVKATVRRLVDSGVQIKLEMGSGPVRGQVGWTTLDVGDGADLRWDLNEPLPFPDESVSAIYSSHVCEHFHHKDLMRLLQECRRILKSGGTFSVCVPDASIYIRGYLNPEAFPKQTHMVYHPAIVNDAQCRMDIVNYMAYMDGHHRYMFDTENLLHNLSQAGFLSVRTREFDPKRDMEIRRHESIYAIGFKG